MGIIDHITSHHMGHMVPEKTHAIVGSKCHLLSPPPPPHTSHEENGFEIDRQKPSGRKANVVMVSSRKILCPAPGLTLTLCLLCPVFLHAFKLDFSCACLSRKSVHWRQACSQRGLIKFLSVSWAEIKMTDSRAQLWPH